MTRKQLYEHYRMVWSKLPDDKKLPYITMAIEAKQKYDVSITIVDSFAFLFLNACVIIISHIFMASNFYPCAIVFVVVCQSGIFLGLFRSILLL